MVRDTEESGSWDPLAMFAKLPSEIWMRIAFLSDAKTAAAFAAADKNFRAIFVRPLYCNSCISFEAEPADMMLLLQRFIEIETAPYSSQVYQYIQHASLKLTLGGDVIRHLSLVEVLPSLMARALSKLRNVARLDLDLQCLDQNLAIENLIAFIQDTPKWNINHLNMSLESDLDEAVLKQCNPLQTLCMQSSPKSNTLVSIMEYHASLERLYIPFWRSGGLLIDNCPPLSPQSLQRFLKDLPRLQWLIVYDLNKGRIRNRWYARNPYNVEGFLNYVASVVEILRGVQNLRCFAVDLPFDPQDIGHSWEQSSEPNSDCQDANNDGMTNDSYCIFAKRQLSLLPQLEQFSIITPHRSVYSAYRSTDSSISPKLLGGPWLNIDCFPHSLMPSEI
ncbi:hypothetical protein HJFPF1_09538 [Paramyrothecium foliicola]|nr:hypothetical protein HJFPF1_09538 [Paramyrothecium foliicola]